ncbi:DUF2829 domain-containing protein [Xenorhabdus sp. Sc-CR9]|uniref:DUF2829 domain-containing protein n=1 Tax=Xenorhabdus sp. Sc-CR9 TaxID=2584468 RepID=UPI001F40870C|nr:DUF2829 domain-containing protein [Xenorhabdus sp. Sc-CR9]
MSDVIKPENECPFNPEQYECHCITAPVGSFSWALIQLKLRKRVARSVWGDKGIYLAITPRVNGLTVEDSSAYAVDGVAVGAKYDYLTHIDLHNEHGNFVPWQPTQEDMMACDWGFFEDKVKLKPSVEPTYQLKARLTVGEHTDSSNEFQYWGYTNVMGKWEEISNNIPLFKGVAHFCLIQLVASSRRHFLLNSKNLNEAKKHLGSKRLVVRCLSKEYDLGVAEIDSATNLLYKQPENSLALEELFIASVDKTLEIEFNFFDN